MELTYQPFSSLSSWFFSGLSSRICGAAGIGLYLILA